MKRLKSDHRGGRNRIISRTSSSSPSSSSLGLFRPFGGNFRFAICRINKTGGRGVEEETYNSRYLTAEWGNVCAANAKWKHLLIAARKSDINELEWMQVNPIAQATYYHHLPPPSLPPPPSPARPVENSGEIRYSWRSTWYQSNFVGIYKYIYIYFYYYYYYIYSSFVPAVKLAMRVFFFSLSLSRSFCSSLVECARNIFRLIFPRQGGGKKRRERGEREKKDFSFNLQKLFVRRGGEKTR